MEDQQCHSPRRRRPRPGGLRAAAGGGRQARGAEPRGRISGCPRRQPHAERGMSQARALYHLMRADFLERVRRYSFLVTLGLAVWLGWAVSTGKLKLWISDSRGIYNSAWVGLLMAMVVNAFVS